MGVVQIFLFCYDSALKNFKTSRTARNAKSPAKNKPAERTAAKKKEVASAATKRKVNCIVIIKLTLLF